MIVRNYLNYIGSKDRYLPQILSFIEEGARLTNGTLLIDLFCGSAVVSVNSAHWFKNIKCNDCCTHLIELHDWIKNTNKKGIFETLDDIVNQYELSKINRRGFLALRQSYNESDDKSLLAPEFYMLVTHAFNYLIRFNKSGGFSVPFGTNRSSFNSSLRKKLDNWKDKLDELNSSGNRVDFISKDFVDYGNDIISNINGKYLLFVDPPYSASISEQPYRSGKWSEEDDRNLLKLLNIVNSTSNYFVFTNCITNNGVTNKILQEWLYANRDKYITTPVSVDYSNCSYHRFNKGKTQEVIISNFNLGVDKHD